MSLISFHSSSKRLGWGMVLAAGAMVMAACGSGSPNSQNPVASPTSVAKASSNPYVFHVLLSETGQGAFLGAREDKALKGYVAYLNAQGGIGGHSVTLDIKDNHSDPQTSVSFASQWIAKKVPFIFNGSIAAANRAVDALAGSDGPVIYDLSPVNPAPPDSYIFASGISYKLDLEAILNTLHSKGTSNIAFLNTTDVSGAAGWPVLKSLLSNSKYSSFHVVSHQTYDPTAVSITTQMSVIKSKNPQALIIWATGTPLGAALQAQHQLNMGSIPTYTSAGNAVPGEMQHLSGVLPDHIFFPTGAIYLPPAELPTSIAPVISTFQSIVAKSGGHPNDGWGLAYAPALMLVSALNHLGVDATAPQIKDYFQKLSAFPNIYGVFHMSTNDHSGIGLSGVYMTTWNGSTFVQASGPSGLPQ